MQKQGNCVKRFDGGDISTLEASAGESFLIRGIYVIPETDNDYLVLKVDRKTVGVYRIYGRSGNHLDVMRGGYIHKNLMEFLQSKGVNCSIPVAEGQTFTATTAGTAPVIVIVYDTYDAGDIRADMPNGTDSKEYMFVQYMDTSETIADDITITLNESLSPAEFPDFPCGKSVPANTEIDILGLAGCPCGYSPDPGGLIGSSYVKMIKEREVLFDEDRNGIPFFWNDDTNLSDVYQAKYSLIGSCTSQIFTLTYSPDISYNVTLGDPLMFEPVLNFKSGEELLMKMSFVKSLTRTLPVDTIDLAAIMKVKMS